MSLVFCFVSILEVSKRTASKILSRMNAGCSRCGWNRATCDIHHIVPKSKGGTDEHSNLSLLCPNCHREVHNGNFSHKELITLEVTLADWKDYYYSGKTVDDISIDTVDDITIDIVSESDRTKPRPNQRKVERPPLKQILEDIEKLGYSGTGRKYGVSDNSIRKWVKWETNRMKIDN